MILTCAQMKALEEGAFAGGASAGALMEQAGAQMADAIIQAVGGPGCAEVFFGKGHNGGDALVAARHLLAKGWQVRVRPAFEQRPWAELTERQAARLEAARAGAQEAPAAARGPLVVLDGLLGIGAGGALREPVAGAAREINRLRQEANATVFALDLPTGLDGDTGAAGSDAVVADWTLTVGAAKAGLVADGAANHVGRIAVLPLAELSARMPAAPEAVLATARELAPLWARRRFDSHKGDYGRVGIVAGSPGMSGAAVMAAEACLHAGAGLVTVYVLPEALPLVAARVAPEVMVKAVASYGEVGPGRHDVLAVGPGLGATRRAEILALIESAPQPMVVDADGLNDLAHDLSRLRRCAGPRLLTPHPGEMARLLRESVNLERRETVRTFTGNFPVTLLLKGSRTLVGQSGRPLSYNSTGNPGMASGGMGDVLTGVLAALAGQGLALYDAARLGAWLCGRAAERAVQGGGYSQESLSATAVVAHLGGAFGDLRAGVY